jgi:hypothetical protein
LTRRFFSDSHWAHRSGLHVSGAYQLLDFKVLMITYTFVKMPGAIVAAFSDMEKSLAPDP